jgi:hypothetical protein
MFPAWLDVRRYLISTATLVAVVLLGAPVASVGQETAALSDREFWSLTEQLSEPEGQFVSNSGSPDNLLSNEGSVSVMAAALAGRVKPGGVYLGVGPEQNFTYIAAMRARMAFVTDIRRGNLHPASSVQGALRDVVRSGGFRRAAFQPNASGWSVRRVEREPAVRRVSVGRTGRRGGL